MGVVPQRHETQIMHVRRQEVASERRQTIAHGVSRGLGGSRNQALAGAKESEGEIGANVFSFAPPELIHPSALSHG